MDNRRKNASSSVKKEVIDVDAFHSRYDDPEGFVQVSSAEEFRKSWRNLHKERPVGVDRSRSRSAVADNSGFEQGQSSTSSQARPDFPSTLGPSIHKAISQKKRTPSSESPSNPSKRQKTSAGPSRLTHSYRDSALSGDEWPDNPVACSDLNYRPPSPGLMVVDEGPRQQSMAATVIKSSLKFSTPPPRSWKQDDIQQISKSTATSIMTPRQLEKTRMEVIELFSDDESHSVMEPSQSCSQSISFPQRSNPPIEFSSDSEHSDGDWNPPGWDLNDPHVWRPVPKNVNKEESVLPSMENRTICCPPPLPRYRWQDTSRWLPPPPPPRQPLYIWDKLRLVENLRWRPRPRPMLMEQRKPFTRPKDIDFNMHKLNKAVSSKHTPGTINAIEQFEGLTFIGSACDGGLADSPDEVPSPYNRPGSLSVWSDNRLVVLDAHMRKAHPQKYYTINDVKFDRASGNCFASIGEDKKFRLWSLDTKAEESKWIVTVTYSYAFVPHALAFRPGSSILAVAEKKVLVYDISDETIMPPELFPLHDRGSSHTIGAIAWGCECTADHLFASSEPTLRTFTGAHKVFDLQSRKAIYQLDAQEAGDVIAVDSTGTTLGLCTQAEANHHILRLYDIRRRDPKAFASIDLLPFSSRGNESFEGEMNVATFSPDQIYLAIARNDNYTHIYDRRWLGKRSFEPLFKYRHYGESKTACKQELYGVVQAQWLQSSWTTRTCLVTGGEDGCVRMWDPSIAAQDEENGQILAEVNYDVSQFSIGDPFVGDHRLVVGDSSGEVTIFDHICV